MIEVTGKAVQMIQLAQRLADHAEISSDRVLSVIQYLRGKLRRQSVQGRPISFSFYRNMRILEEALRIRDPKWRKRTRIL